jgi:hypothetical protein
MGKKIKLFFLLILICSAVKAQVYKDPKAPIPLRVKDLLSRMTLEEKIGQMTASDLDKPLNATLPTANVPARSYRSVILPGNPSPPKNRWSNNHG